MKTKIFTLLIAVLANVTSLDATIVDGIAYSLNRTDSTAQVIAGGTYSGHIVVPQYVTYRDISFCVTSIGEGAFANSAGLSSIALPNSIATIGNEAFKNCSNLDSCIFGKGLTDIGQEAFAGCNSLVALVIYAATPPVVESGNDIDKDWCTLYLPEKYNTIYAAADWWKDFPTISYTVDDYDTDNRSNEKELLNVQIGGVDVTFDDTIGIARLEWNVDFSSLPVTFSLSPHATADFISGTTHDFSTPLYITVTSERGTQKRYTLKAKRTSENKCGDDVYYNVINDTLYIEGSGSMYDYSVSNSPFSSLMFSHVTIGEDVSSIGRYAFRDCTSLISITIPNSVTSIGNRTFFGCSGLTSIIIPNCITSIGGGAFSGCSGLTSITIPNSITSIGSNAFSDCIGLTRVYITNLKAWCNITFGSGSETNPLGYAHNLYLNGELITDLVIPESITSIKNSAFYGCSSINSIVIPSSVTSIGDRAFFGCSGLSSIVIPNGVNDISDYAFKECYNLISVTLPSSITSIGSDIFLDCTNLANIYVPCGEIDRFNEMLSNDTRIKYKPLFEVYSINLNATNGSVLVNEETLTVCDSTDAELTVTPDYGYHFVQWSDGNIDNPRTITLTQDTTLTAEFAPNKYTISVTCDTTQGSIDGENGEFDYLTSLSYRAIAKEGYYFTQWSDGNTDNPRALVLTQDTMFTALFTPNMPNKYTISVTCNTSQGSIEGENGEFDCLTSLSYRAIANFGYHFVQWSDGNTDNPRTIILTQDTTLTAEFAIGCLAPISGNCGDNLTWELSCDCVLTISGTGAMINDDVPWYLQRSAIKSVIVANGVTTIGNSAFYRCTSLTSVTIPNSVTIIGDYAFYRCTSLTAVTIGNSVTSIGNHAFSECSGLTSVTIPNSVISIGEYAFYKCTGLTAVTIGNSVTYIGQEAFSRCGLTSITIPNSVTSIGRRAFYLCSDLTSATIGNSVISIEEGAFRECTRLKSIVWNAKDCSINNIFPSSVESFVLGNDVITIPASLCKGMANLISVTIPNSVTSIGEEAFRYCSGLISIEIPNSVISIEGSAFTECTGLIEVTIGKNITALGKSVFNRCAAIKEVHWNAINYRQQKPNNDSNSFPFYSARDSITSFIFGDSVTYIPAYLTKDYTALDTIIIPASVTEIGAYSFNNQTKVVICQAETPPTISSNVFGQCEINVPCGSVDEYKSAWSVYASQINYQSLPYSINVLSQGNGNVDISGPTICDTAAQIKAIPDYGYHFVKWSDGNTDNPRTIIITQDTAFTAIFEIAREGKCGDDLALTWNYDVTDKVLTICGEGTLNSNYTFGIEAPTTAEKLIIAEGVTTIGNSAFAGYSTLKHLSVPASVKTIYEQAFYNCTGLQEIYSYRATPPTAYSTTFDGIEKFECVLHVLSASVNMYKAATGWRDFYYIESIGAEGTTVSDNQVTVETTDNTATMTWPTDDNAASYTIQITKDGVVFCTLIFNGNGQLTGIAFAPSKNGSHNSPAATLTANGMQFTVTGLNSATHYAFTLQTKDDQETVLASYTGEFTTTGESQVPTGIENTPFPSGEGWGEATKVIRDGQIFILRGDKTYTVTGQEIR